ncbi:hypothetical protein [Halochromatium salexigens]|nr:hypothetical protein [Halochromatium salexigens]
MIDAYRGGPSFGPVARAARLLAGPAPLPVLSAPGWLMPLVLALLAPGAAAQADEDFELEQLELVCIEQPMRAVSFGEPGELSYGEQAPKEADPIEVRVTKSRPGEDFNYDFAIIESSTDDLETDEAIWLGDKQVEAQQGRFKLNLSNLVMTLTETDPDGSAHFRRFECENRSGEEAAAESD